MDDEIELQAIAQECTQALVAVGQGGSGYALNDTINLPGGVVVKATTMTGNAVASVTIINAGSTTAPPANPVSQVSTSGAGTGAKFNLQWAAVLDVFPGFTPIYPPPPVGQGSGSTPPFPPPSIPPPVGPLVGPAVASAAVPPSVAGVVQPTYRTGSATSPAIATFFPSFSVSGWPVPPVQTTNTPPPTMLTTLPSPVHASGIN